MLHSIQMDGNSIYLIASSSSSSSCLHTSRTKPNTLPRIQRTKQRIAAYSQHITTTTARPTTRRDVYLHRRTRRAHTRAHSAMMPRRSRSHPARIIHVHGLYTSRAMRKEARILGVILAKQSNMAAGCVARTKHARTRLNI